MFEVPKIKSAKGKVKLKGDKSVSHRALIFSALSEKGEKTKIFNISSAKDVISTSECLKKLGAKIHISEEYIEVEGKGIYLSQPQSVIYAGNSGTTARIFSTILSAQKFPSVLDGDESLRKRPMKRVVEPLRALGAKIWGKENGNKLPLVFEGVGKLKGGKSFSLDVPSAQVKTALIIANFWSDDVIKVKEPTLSRDHTERILPIFSVNVRCDSDGFIFCEGKPRSPKSIKIPGDISSASFLISLGIINKNSEVEIEDVLLNKTRIGFIEALKSMGAEITYEVEKEESGEPTGRIIAKTSELKAKTFSGEIIPKMIDEIPILSCVAVFSEGIFSVKNAEELRVKETDRIKAIVENLKTMGIEVEEYKDGFAFEGLGEKAREKLKGEYYLKSFGDHRIAMSFFILGSSIKGKVFIDDISSVSISYPEFFKDFEFLAEK
jgi:3-phosphoshikimate 1-carboxyvinyltransferase